MATLLVKNAEIVVTMDAPTNPVKPGGYQGQEIRNGGLYCHDGIIEKVGPSESLPSSADTILDLQGHILTPGLVNTHHHLFQSLTRVLPPAQDAALFEWLQTLYPIWGRMTPDHIYVSAVVGLAELALTGCTTSSDHLYIFPNGARLDDEIQAATDIGLRFHACRGSMSIGESEGGLPPDNLIENETQILSDCIRVIDAYHDPEPYAMTRVALAPCSPFSVSTGLMRDSAELARERNIGLHTHLAENDQDITYSKEKFGMRPGEYVESLGWLGPRVWHAHCVQLNEQEINLFSENQTGVAHCPCSNMRLASGIAPVSKMIAAGVSVGLGVDGSASNDSGHLLNEARQALLLQRVLGGPGALTARQALYMATRGGAEILNRDDIGSLEPGKAADFSAFNLNKIEFSGTSWDPVAALIFCGPVKSSYTVVNGKIIVENGNLLSIDLPRQLETHQRLTHSLIDG